MEDKKEWKETIWYIKDTTEDGRTSWTGQSINYGCVCSSWESVEELKRTMTAMIGGWIQHAQKTMAQEDPLEMKECTPEEWEAKEDNIDYWEIERIKRILKRPTVQKKWRNIIMEEVAYRGTKTQTDVEQLALSIIQALITQPNE